MSRQFALNIGKGKSRLSKWLLRMALLTLTPAIISLASYFFKSPKRILAGQLSSYKDQILMPKNRALGVSHTNKVSGPLLVKMKRTVADESIVPGVPFTLDVEIFSEEDIEGVNLKWSLPDEIVLVNGEIERTIDFSSGNGGVKQTSLTVTSTSEQNQQIHLFVSGQKNGTSFGTSIQFNTLDQEMIENEDVELVHRSKENMALESKLSRTKSEKIFR
ncbi:MAG: hypothetical protein IPJ71_10000 [Bdellovibrionales bacterium]|nr:hypothetical protein [Bdellovibrionales bacterium]